MRKFLTALLIVACMLTASVACAEVKTYTGVGEYYMSDFETPNVAQLRAKQRAEQNACEKAGVYVKSFSRTVNLELDEDVIETMTSGILKIVDVQYHREHADNMTLFRATITAQIDSDAVSDWLDKDSKEQSMLVNQLNELRKAYAAQEKLIAELKKKIADVKTDQDKEQLTREFAEAEKNFLSTQEISDLYNAVEEFDEDYDRIINFCNEALKLNPNNDQAYFGMAFCYKQLDDSENALKCVNKAVQLNPNNPEYYLLRGYIYHDNLEDYERAATDYRNVLNVKFDNPEEAKRYRITAYDELVLVYSVFLEDYNRAIEYCNKWIETDPASATAYRNRGECWNKLGDKAKAQADFAKAKELDAKG